MWGVCTPAGVQYNPLGCMKEILELEKQYVVDKYRYIGGACSKTSFFTGGALIQKKLGHHCLQYSCSHQRKADVYSLSFNSLVSDVFGYY